MAVNSGILKIENKAITSITSHERCIIEDGCQLSEMIEKIGDNVCKNNIHNFIELFVEQVIEKLDPSKDFNYPSIEAFDWSKTAEKEKELINAYFKQV